MTTTVKTSLRQNVTNADRMWYTVDAATAPLGKIAVSIANVLRGRHRVDFTPHVDGGDYVVVTNAEKVVVTGNKESNKIYFRHSGYKGSLKEASLSEVRSKQPERILMEAVRGMLPRTKLRDEQMKRLKVIIGTDHPFLAQKPQPLPKHA